jgi:hypothetical protein
MESISPFAAYGSAGLYRDRGLGAQLHCDDRFSSLAVDREKVANYYDVNLVEMSCQ